MPASNTPDDLNDDASPETAASPDADAAEDVPMNRAERRAKGKHKDSQQFGADKIHPGRVNPGHVQRQYSNRRSGG